MLYLTYKIMWVMCMIKKQETMILSEYTGIYDLVVPKDNMLRKINEYMTMDIKNAIDKITAILPQVVYSIVGAVLIFFVCVVLVPVVQVYMGGFMFDTM